MTDEENINSDLNDLNLILLTLGFISLTVAIVSAYSRPATSYELSIYSQTPLVFWIGVLLSLVISIYITFDSSNTRVRALALSLGILLIMTLILLPIIRNYYFVGEGDSLSHLGRALNFRAGTESIVDSRYPLSHLLSVIIYFISGIEIRTSLMLLFSIFVLIYILFVTLIGRLFSNDIWMITVSFFSSWLLFPVNHFTGHMHPHPTSYAMFYVPLLAFMFILLMVSYKQNYLVLLVASIIGMVLVHPQQAANVIILFGTVGALQLATKIRLRRLQVLISNAKTHIHIVIMVIIFWIWTEGLEKVAQNIQRPIANFLARSEREPGGNVRDAVPSLEAAGGSIEEIFIKLFLVSFIYCIFAAAMVGVSLVGLYRNKSKRFKNAMKISFDSTSSNLLIIYLTGGFVAIVGLFFIYILADQSRQYFRHHSFMMVIITILGSLFLGRLLKTSNKRISDNLLIPGICVLFITFSLLSIPVIHASPYIYMESEHVPESQMEGYESAFKYQDETIPFAWIRSHPRRYHDAIIGERRTVPLNVAEPPPNHFSEQGSLRSQYEEQTYLVVTDRDRTRDRDLHSGIRYTREDYDHFDEEPGIDRIQDNKGLSLYKIRS